MSSGDGALDEEADREADESADEDVSDDGDAGEDPSEGDSDESDVDEGDQTDTEDSESDEDGSTDSDTVDSLSAEVHVLNGAVDANDTLVCFRFGHWEFQAIEGLQFGDYTRFDWTELGEVEVLFVPNDGETGDCTSESEHVVRYGFELAEGDRAVVTLTGVYPHGLRATAMVNQFPEREDGRRGIRFANRLADFADITATVVSTDDAYAPIPLGTEAAENVLVVPEDLGLQVVFNLPDLRSLGFSLTADGDECITTLIGAYADQNRELGPPSLISICDGGVSESIPVDPEVYLLNAVENLRDQDGDITGLTLELQTESPRIAYGAMSQPFWVSDELDPITAAAGLRPIETINLTDWELNHGERYLVVLGGSSEEPNVVVSSADTLENDDGDAVATVINANPTRSIEARLFSGSDFVHGDLSVADAMTRSHEDDFTGFELVADALEEAWALDPGSRQLFVIATGLARPEPRSGDFDLFTVEFEADALWTLVTPEQTQGTIWVRTVNALMEEGSMESDFHPDVDIQRGESTDWVSVTWPDSEAEAYLGSIGSVDPPETGDIVTSIWRGSAAASPGEGFSAKVTSFVEDPWDNSSNVTFLPGLDEHGSISLAAFGDNFSAQFSALGETNTFSRTELLAQPDTLHPGVGSLDLKFTLFTVCVEANLGRCLNVDEAAGADMYLVPTGRMQDQLAAPPTLLVIGRNGVMDAAPADVDVLLFNGYGDNIEMTVEVEELGPYDALAPGYPGVRGGETELRPDLEYDFSLINVDTENVLGEISTHLTDNRLNLFITAAAGEDETPFFYQLEEAPSTDTHAFLFLNLSYAETPAPVRMYTGGETGGWSNLGSTDFNAVRPGSLADGDTRVGFGPDTEDLPLLANTTIKERPSPRMFVSVGGPDSCTSGFQVVELNMNPLDQTLFPCVD